LDARKAAKEVPAPVRNPASSVEDWAEYASVSPPSFVLNVLLKGSNLKRGRDPPTEVQEGSIREVAVMG
jgi:hypothetical protein